MPTACALHPVAGKVPEVSEQQGNICSLTIEQWFPDLEPWPPGLSWKPAKGAPESAQKKSVSLYDVLCGT